VLSAATAAMMTTILATVKEDIRNARSVAMVAMAAMDNPAAMVATVAPATVATAATAAMDHPAATVAMVAPATAAMDNPAAMVAMVAPATVDMDVASADMVARLRPMEALATDIRVDTAAGHTDIEEP